MSEHKLQLLVIEDDDLDQMIIKRALKDSRISHELTLAENHEQGKMVTEGKEFDCIFLDYNLPGGTGLELLKTIRESGNTSPIVMVTSQGDEKIAVEAMKLGADDYLPKSLISGDGIKQIIRYMINKKKQAIKQQLLENQLLEAQKQLRTVVSNAPIILFSLDNKGSFQLFEGRGLELLNIDKQKILNKSLQENSWLPITQKNYDRAMNGEEFTIITEWKSKYFETYYSPVKDESKQIVGVLGIASDKTTHVLAEKELKKAKQLAEETVKIKEQFLANISHEIRTPMNGIIGLTRILLKTELNPEQLKYLQSIHSCSDSLMIIINDLLDVSKIEAGKMTLEKISFSLSELVNHTIELFQAKADEKSVQLVLEKDPSLPHFVEGDPTRLSQILNNLISNAIKFTEKGEVRLRVKLASTGNNRASIQFEVKDSGIGIAEESLDSIFESFTQANSDTTRKFGGTGLGLTIVKNLVEMQQGEIQVKSKINFGTTFSFTIPYTLSNGIEEQKIAPEDHGTDVSHLKILVAEDNKINQMVIKKTFSEWGVEIDLAENGKLALEALKTKDYDLILMDIQMPEMDGYTAVKEIRSAFPEPKRSVPILAMTAHASASEKEKCLAAGMQGSISKPFDPLTLKKKIIQVCKIKNAHDNTSKPVKIVVNTQASISDNVNPENFEEVQKVKSIPHTDKKYQSANGSTTSINLTYLKQISGNNQAFFLEMIETFLNMTPEALSQMDSCIKQQNWEEIKNIAHRIKPSYAYVGLKDVQKTLTQIENWNDVTDDKSIMEALVSNVAQCSREAFEQLKNEIDSIEKKAG